MATAGAHTQARVHLVPGLVIAAVVTAIDQGFKWWMLEIFGIAERQRVVLTPFFDLVMVWNRGISYGLFAQDGDLGRTVLITIICAGLAALAWWLATCHRWRVAAALGLIIGGGIGNLIDRIVHGAVADFFRFHLGTFEWYVFNLADVAVVAGVAILLYDLISDFAGHRRRG